ncbi:MAG: hypothetical protein U5K69_07875 [Balneolaceae bacterium]|nr:hypothetical protein [Balneolaceae bacterium]
MTLAPVQDQVAYATQHVNRNSNPSELEITDLRIAEISDVVFRTPIIRIYTNQGIVGHGDVRDGAAKEYALMLKSRLLGENPCNVERLFKIHQAVWPSRAPGRRRFRRGDGPVGPGRESLRGCRSTRSPGGKYRDKVRVYCDTTVSDDPQEYADRMQARHRQGLCRPEGGYRHQPAGRHTRQRQVRRPDWQDLQPWQY